MTQKLRRSEALEVKLVINDDTFIRPPRDAQRNALLNKALREFTDDLSALHRHAANFVAGSVQSAIEDRTNKPMSDEEIMEDWQIPLMQAMTNIATESQGDILEIGFGRGVSSSMIQHRQVRSHTIIECNDSVVTRFEQWSNSYPGRDIRLVQGLWQDTIGSLDLFDGIFFHTYPLNEDEYMQYVNGGVTFAGHFFPSAAAHLRPGGVFTYLTNEIDSLSRAHQRLIFEHFSSFSLQIVPLTLPDNVGDVWWASSMAVVKAVK